MKKKKLIGSAVLALLSASMLTSCDYSNFSLFGLFYNIYVNSLTNKTEKKSEVFVPEAYRTTSTSTVDSGTLNTTEQLTLLPDDTYSLIYYQSITKGETESTYLSYAMFGKYTRSGNVVSLAYSTSTYTNRSQANTSYINGNNETARKESFKKVYNSDTASFVVKTDGTFELGTSDSSSETAKGISTANTYYYLDTVGRVSYKMISLLDDTNYLAINFSLDSKNQENPVSNFMVQGTYLKYDDKKTDEYDVIKIGMGRGHMYASNNGSDMEFDVATDDSFIQWWGMSVGAVRSMRITKTGYVSTTGDVIDAYSFELLDTELDGGDPEPVVPAKEALVELKGKKNEAITLTIYKDGSYAFAWEANKVEETGTWTYDSTNDTLNLTCGESVQKFTLNEEKTFYTLHYVYTVSDQLTQDYEISVSDWNSLFRVLLSLKGDKKDTITLDIYANGTYTFAYTDYKTEESGTWTYDGNKDILTLSAGTDHSCTSTKNANGTYTISYIYSKSNQLTQDYTISKSTWDSTFARTLTTLKGLKSELFTLSIYSNLTYSFNYEVTYNGTTNRGGETGKWAYDSKADAITFTCGDAVNTTTKNSDGTYALNYISNISDQLTQNYQIDSENWNSIVGKAKLTLAGQNVSATTMTFNADNTYVFHYNVQDGQFIGDEYGVWSYDSATDKVTLNCGSATNTMEKQEDGSYKLSYISDKSSALTQDFVTYNETFRSTFKHQEASCSLSKTSPVNPYFYFYSDGSYEFGFATYKSSEKGTWSYNETTDTINLTCFGKTNSFTKESDGSYTCNYISNRSSQMTFDHFILSATDANTILNKTSVEIIKNNEKTKFSFTFYQNHKYKFSYITYGVNEYGTWSYDSINDKFVFVCNNTTNYAAKQKDGTYLISYISNRSSQMTQDYTLTALDASKLIALA